MAWARSTGRRWLIVLYASCALFWLPASESRAGGPAKAKVASPSKAPARTRVRRARRQKKRIRPMQPGQRTMHLRRRPDQRPAPARLRPVQSNSRRSPAVRVRSHIRGLWNSKLRRGPSNLMQALQDPKLAFDSTPTLYISAHENKARVKQQLRQHLGKDADRITVRHLPKRGTKVPEHGLLYLPNDFVVPGYAADGQINRFNEQYGWDTHRMVQGLLVGGKVQLARGMVENQLYQVRHYGTVLNANRTWSLSRSQPPYLTQTVLEVYRKTGDRAWLAGTLDAVKSYHQYWTKNSRRTGKTGLSRYYDTGRGLPPEADIDEFERDKQHFRSMPQADSGRYFDRARNRLTRHFEKGTRSVRASGFDTTNRFGPGGADTHEYNPVDLNSLLFRMEMDMAGIHRELAKDRRPSYHRAQARKWTKRAEKRRTLVNKYMWNPKRGQFFDYNVVKGQRSSYEFASTFTPLATGLATPEQAYGVLKKALPRFETTFGIKTSRRNTGHQWDGDVVWAPLVQDAVAGFRRYQNHPRWGKEFKAAADRLSVNYLSMITREFVRTGHIYEKYDAVRGTSDVKPAFGYTSNEKGFGWTNSAYLRMYEGLGPRERKLVEQMKTVPVPGSKPAAAPGNESPARRQLRIRSPEPSASAQAP